jgi:hypothetical protein
LLALFHTSPSRIAAIERPKKREQARALPNSLQIEYRVVMKRPSKKEIREAVQKLKEPKEGSKEIEQTAAKPQEKSLNSQRIRKKGI